MLLRSAAGRFLASAGGRPLVVSLLSGLTWVGCGTGTGSRTQSSQTTATSAPSAPTPGSASSAAASVSAPALSASSAAPSASAVVSAQPPVGGCAAALFCDDFEDDTLGESPQAPWTASANGGSVEVSADRAAHGTQSVHLVGDMGQYARAFISLSGAPVFPAAAALLFGRMRIYVEQLPESAHWTIIQAEGDSADASYRAFFRYGGQHDGGRLMANYETEGVSTDCWQHSATKLPTATWTCVEWSYSVAGDELRFWLNGKELNDVHVQGSGEGCVENDLQGAWVAPQAFDVLRVGWEHYQETGPHDVYIDDVGVSTERIGCEE